MLLQKSNTSKGRKSVEECSLSCYASCSTFGFVGRIYYSPSLYFSASVSHFTITMKKAAGTGPPFDRHYNPLELASASHCLGPLPSLVKQNLSLLFLPPALSSGHPAFIQPVCPFSVLLRVQPRTNALSGRQPFPKLPEATSALCCLSASLQASASQALYWD